jgi:hypothetical protein
MVILGVVLACPADTDRRRRRGLPPVAPVEPSLVRLPRSSSADDRRNRATLAYRTVALAHVSTADGSMPHETVR